MLTRNNSLKHWKVVILSLKDAQIWNNYLDRFPLDRQDIYFTPEYYKLYEHNDEEIAFCFVFEMEEHLALFPFIKKKSIV